MSELFLSISIEPLEEGGYLATSDDLQGLIAQGRTMAETLEIAQDVARKLIEVRSRTRRSVAHENRRYAAPAATTDQDQDTRGHRPGGARSMSRLPILT